ncbi:MULTISPECIES: 6-phospho-3-hexuloisomerase [Bifidobacterium]|jgi:6-phospho-3-hexuloisomerase|uniref:6-phospho-3-hexuloisomerase n=1 Tax=Bifidobacterium tibiigranuli TaxID=2172043 RepID=A0A5N6S2N2_9BIFI|nr:6-phospho-3-hexuloisomerase [Bifidobacterium tibiigranuli]KAE8127384.1 6-phospho-3-hexuloisomerase [Bifidobacterium tibiigranuli]KAE8129775.1 6-phospho-3-hexuloisomerase [Bifidobacterium tibiigranuli]MCI1212268.1 6-phospho-3-hexuloisomerase [Bifidobacterium tibiigranuli]MCI1221519.1 6-phospho-3-hexuloisomerase [Bifidobacterium tibiigranuli]
MRILDQITEEIQGVMALVDEDKLAEVSTHITKDKRVYADGEGRSGFQARSFAMRLMHIGYTSYMMGETITPSVHEGDVFLAISGSGKTKNTVSDATAAKSVGAMIIAVTSKPDSPLGTLADYTIIVPGRVKNDDSVKSIQLLSSLFDQCVHITLDALCLMLSRRDHTSDQEASRNHSNIE